jgi:large subunit ribosomal protein L25
LAFFLLDFGTFKMEAVLKAETRSASGSRNCRELRYAGKVPAILYGKGQDVVQLSLDVIELREYFAKVAKREVKLEMNGATTVVTIGEVQRHPISRDVVHMDFIRN